MKTLIIFLILCSQVLAVDKQAYIQAFNRSSQYWTGKIAKRPKIKVKESKSRVSTGATTFRYSETAIADVKIRIEGTKESIEDNLIPHEVDHVVRHSIIKHPIPRWLDEGCSINMESEEEQEYFLKKAARLPDNVLTPEYLDSTVYTKYEQDYCCGFSLVEYLIELKGPKTLFRFQRDPRKPTEKFQDYYDMTPEQFLKDWDDWR